MILSFEPGGLEGKGAILVMTSQALSLFLTANHLSVLYLILRREKCRQKGKVVVAYLNSPTPTLAPTKVLATIMFDLPHDTGP